MLILIAGLPGTGKTTFAKALARSIDAVHLNSDVIRAGLDYQGIYSLEAKKAVYREMLRQTGLHLLAGRSVIVDATFYKQMLRMPFVRLAARYGVRVKWIEMRASERIVEQRMSQRRDFSEADLEVYLVIRDNFEPLRKGHLVLQTEEMDQTDLIQRAVAFIEKDIILDTIPETKV